jgi:hypothetical protein
MREDASVDLVVNTHRGDVAFLDPTLRHIVGSLANAPLRRRILVVDESNPEGRFALADSEASSSQLATLTKELLRDGIVSEALTLDWSPAQVSAVMQSWYGDAAAPLRCGGGTPIYQFCAAVDCTDADYVLHLDSDMLLHSSDHGTWVCDAVEALETNQDAIAVQPMGGPPMATTLAQMIFGARARSQLEGRWAPGGNVSSRVFVIDRRRLHSRVLPLQPDDPDDRWEQAINATARRRGMQKYTLADESTYALHPKRHTDEYLRALPDLIWAVERDVYPFRRTGYRWDIRTDGSHLLPWRAAIASARFADRMNNTAVGGRPRFGGAGA